MMIELKGERASARIQPSLGGTVRSLRLASEKAGLIDVLWAPDRISSFKDDCWPGGGMPICFPFAGRVWHRGKTGRYSLDESSRIYEMPIHGFGCRESWQVETAESNSVRLKLAASPGTRRLYPFDFEAFQTYTLFEDSMLCRLEVWNCSGKPIPVSAGFHPYFRLPFSFGNDSKNNTASPWSKIELQHDARSLISVTPKGAAGQRQKAPAKPLPLSNSKYANRILGDHGARNVVLFDSSAGVGIQLGWTARSPIRYVVLWGKPDLGFYCIEPWMGLPDAIHHADVFRIRPGLKFKLEIEIRIVE